ncbi:MAG: sodium:proline symporter [Natrialbaceae archaeon]|nr:sodium:proline symporter [Natrialbaceae archaeon]
MVRQLTVTALMIGVLATMTSIGLWYSRGKISSVEDLITARNTMGYHRTTATLIASVMGVWILLSPAEAGAAFGGIAAVAGYAVGEALPMLAFAWIGPRIRLLIPDGHSLTEYALVRYGPVMYGYVLVVTLSYMFIFLAAELTGITSALQLIAGIPRWQTAVLVGGFVLLYTVYGGLRASILTDTIQAAVIVPLLGLTAIGSLIVLGGPTAVHREIVSTDPSLLDPTFITGLRFGFWIAIAILGAELLNQTWWQRVYAATDRATLRRSFLTAAIANALIVFVAGLFGILARGHVEIVTDSTSGAYNASIALFVLLREAFPAWIVIAMGLLALLLVMSSADSLFNAMASTITADLPRLLTDPQDAVLQWTARAVTAIAAIAAIVVSLEARSVLRLFLLADLLGAATMVPLFVGLYSRRATGPGVVLASLAGLAVGLIYFPNPIVRSALSGVPLSRPDPAQSLVSRSVRRAPAGFRQPSPQSQFGRHRSQFSYDRLTTEITRLDRRPAKESENERRPRE